MRLGIETNLSFLCLFKDRMVLNEKQIKFS